MLEDLPDAEYQSDVLRYMNQALEEGISANKRQYHWDKIGETIDAIMGADEPRLRSKRLSKAKLNRVQKITLEMRSMFTDIKMFWEYEANSKRFEPQAEIGRNLAEHWYLSRGIDQSFKDSIDYALVAGSGYLHIFWNPDLPGPGTMEGDQMIGDLDVRAEDPRDVILIRHNGDKRSIQHSRGVIIRRERPTSWLKRTYGKKADHIKPDRTGLEKESPSGRHQREELESALIDAQGPFHEQLFGGSPHQKVDGGGPITDEFTAYLHDFQINKSSKPKEMGDFVDAIGSDGKKIRARKNSWSYVVQPGERLYPFGRRIVFTRYGVIDDGPSRFHFGSMFLPVCKVTLDTWAWSFIGTSPIQPLIPLQRALDENVRVIQDHIRRLGRPGKRYDKNAVSPASMKNVDTRIDGISIAHNPHAGKPFELLHEPPLDPTVLVWQDTLSKEMDELAGVAAMRDFAELGQVPSTETIDKIIESMTPLVRARSRSMEIFMREFAMMVFSAFMQHYTLPIRLRILGAKGMVYEDWNHRPEDFLPDFIDEDDFDERGNVKQDALERGPKADHIRNREFMRFFNFKIQPGSLLDVATITKRLLYLQLSRMGLVDHWTLGEILQIPNLGSPPDWATDITKRLQAEKLMGLGVIASTVGRPPTAQAMPSMTSDGYISESG